MSAAALQKDSLIATAIWKSLKTVPFTVKLVIGGELESPHSGQLIQQN